MSYGHEYWDETIVFTKQCSWRAGVFLAEKMQKNYFEDNERVIIAIIDDVIAGFCTYTSKDDMPDELDFTPFIGFIFVDAQYRGKRLSERLINMACKLGKNRDIKKFIF